MLVVLPSALAAVYLWTRAADQYVSRVGFAVRTEETSSPLDFLSGLTSFSGSSSTDTDILFEFLQSQKLVSDLDSELDLRGIWSKPENDPVFSFDTQGTIEDLTEYWDRMVKLSYGAGSGLIEVEVRAFEPGDATNLTTSLLERSSIMINNLSAIAREDAIKYAREELDSSLDRLKNARAVVTQFRNENQIIDPELDIQSQSGLLAKLQEQQAQTLIDIDLLNATSRQNDPRLLQEERRLEMIEARIDDQRAKFGIGGGQAGNTAYAEIVGDFERLVVDREFAEKSYVTALAAYDGALAESRRKNRYLAAYMEPTRAERAEHPERLTILGLFSLFLFLIWSVLVLVGYSLKDRR